MSRTKKRITTPLIHEKGGYVHEVRRLRDEDAVSEIEDGLADYEAYKETMSDAEWDEFWRAIDADLEYQQAWQQAIDDEACSREQEEES